MADENEVIAEGKEGRGLQPVILASLLTLILGAVGGIFAADYVNGTDGATNESTPSADDELTEGTVITETTTYDLGDFSVNLKDPSTMRILQMSIVLECESGSVMKLEEQTSQLRDAILMFTSEYTVSSLSGMEGKMNLRDEILMRINAIVKPERVERVYFTKFIIGK